MRYVRTEGPTDLPVSLGEAKAHLRLTGIDEFDAEVTGLLSAAIEHLDGREGVLGRAMEPQTWRLETAGPDAFGRVAIDLPPVLSIDQVDVVWDSAVTEWTVANWRVEYDGDRAFIVPVDGASWPSRDRRADAIRVTFTAGYERPEATASGVPMPIRQAILLLVGGLFANKGDQDGGLGPRGLSALITPYRRIRE